jgi:hypothetical protein
VDGLGTVDEVARRIERALDAVELAPAIGHAEGR